MRTSLNIAHTGECPKCYAQFIVYGDVHIGDWAKCPTCRQRLDFFEITGEYCPDKEKRELDIQSL